MKAAELPYAAADNALIEIEANAKIRAAFERLILPNAGVFVGSEYINGEQKIAFTELMKLKETDASSAFRGLFVLVCTVTEYFCKQVIQNIVGERGAAASSFDDLPIQLFAANFVYTGLYFQKGRDTYLGGSARDVYDELADGLVTCRPSSTAFQLNPAVFTEFLGNCTAEQLGKRFKELGLVDPLGDVVGSFPALKEHFGGGGAREIAKRTRETLDNLITRRNGLVHSSTISETVTLDEVLEAADFARALVGGIKDLVEKA